MVFSAVCPGESSLSAEGLASSAPVTGIMETDGTFGGLAGCSGRDCIFHVKYSQGQHILEQAAGSAGLQSCCLPTQQ